ncbi:hypothetical protein Tco_0799761 [Tanacetum coccineum]|uniref:DUF4218 domain-containing protein n=1 Tax=Tanacetum coccineum TaxID=301880 RepID=A0ABQ4ZVC8_9ASTR
MEDDMVKAESHLIDILCNLEQIFPPAFFDIIIHLVIHLLEEALEGGHIPYRWMYSFERYTKKLKNYIQNKAKLEGSIVEGYVIEEALTFCSHYFWGVTTKFNRLDRNVDCPLSNSPESDTYLAEFKSEARCPHLARRPRLARRKGPKGGGNGGKGEDGGYEQPCDLACYYSKDGQVWEEACD